MVRSCPHGHRHHHDPCRVNEHLHSDDDEDENHVHGVDDTSDSESGDNAIRCLSCKEEFSAQDAGTCKECYEEAGETEDELRREIGELKSKIAFLSFLDLDGLPGESTSAGFRGDGGGDGCYRAVAHADVVLVASDEGEDSVPVPAHRAVLVSFVCLVGTC
ncbi:hypothetical protein MLD38_024617 [Melastoma candidum]|uniref:Uncharacterized protein n=1 Tax=Melastoma candidum TaxID=119954 RepID=A0ACB9NXX5_9MYRT|nr:hypothetical protein MLD38_024617 [Melastoma candidum]